MQRITRSAIPIALILTVFGGILRFYDLGSAPYWMDEGFTVNAVLALAERGSGILDSGFSYTCPLYCYPSAWLSGIFGNDPFSYRLLAAIAGTLFLSVFLLIGRRWFGLRITALAAFFATFSYFQIAWSRQARWYTLFELFFWLSLFGFYRSYYDEKGRKLWIALTAAFTFLAAQSHELGYLLPLIFLGWMIGDAIVRKKISYKVTGILAVAGAGATAVIAQKYSVEPSFIFPYYLNFYLRSYWIFFLLSIIALLHPFNVWKKETYFLIFVLLSYVIPLSFFTDIINYRYLFHLTPILFIFGAIGASAIMSDVKNKYGKIAVIAAIIILFFVSGAGTWKPQSMYFLEADDPSNFLVRNYRSFFFVPQPDWNAAYEYIKDNKKEGEAVVTTQPPFNKIFLGEPGYWIRYSYNGKTFMEEKDDKEFYVGAAIINDAEELAALAASSHGYVIIDSYAEHLIPPSVLSYIQDNFDEAWSKETNSYSKVRVYRF